MKAILVNDDKSLSWTEVPNPVMEADDVLVKIHYAAINRADLMQRAGDYPPPPGCPQWMGLEIAGEIVEMAEGAKSKSQWKVGDRVCALLGGGGYAEYANVKYDMLLPVPENMTMEEAAAIPEAYCTAYLNLFIEAKAKPGEVFLMPAGGSGLASVTIPMAKAFGLYVVTTVRSDDLAERIQPLGADRIINTTKENLPDSLKSLQQQGKSVDIALDCVGGEIMGQCLPYLSYGARWIMIAALAGNSTEIDLKNIYVKNIRIIGSTLRSRTPEFKAELLKMLVRDVYPKILQGLIKPSIYRVFPITEAEQAHALMASGKHNGKIVLKVC